MHRVKQEPQFLPLPIRVDFDMEMDEVVDEVFAEEAEEFAGAAAAVVCHSVPSPLLASAS